MRIVVSGFAKAGPTLHPANKDKLRAMLALAAAATAKIPIRPEPKRQPTDRRRVKAPIKKHRK
jgi:hypothetical protein